MEFVIDRRPRWIAALVFFALSWTGGAWAQAPASETFEAQAVESTSIWSTATSEVAGHLAPTALILGHYADDPVQLERKGASAPVARLVDEQFKVEIGLGIGLFDRLELGFVLPVVVHQSGDAFASLPVARSTELAEIRGQLRLKILQNSGFGLGAQVTGYLPTSANAPYQSDAGVGALAMLIADYQAAGNLPWRIAANVGWAFRQEQSDRLISTDDRLDTRLGAEVEVLPERLHILATIFGRYEALSNAYRSFSGGYLGGARIFWGDSGWSSTVGAGGGIGGGYGTPDFRLLASLGFGPASARLDQPVEPSASPYCRDGQVDGCIREDGDGLGGADQCPDEPEDIDGFQDDDGCPDPDNDNDGIGDFNDACPDKAGLKELSGCPLVDEDGDGIDASVDRCPDEPEDFDDFQDSDGCAEPDNDGDGISDLDDQCPSTPEFINGVADEDGCPDQGDSSVRLIGDRLEILERVYFDTNRASIKARSFSLLKQIASVLKAHPEIELMRVQGHTDARGADAMNLRLSQQRAVSVKEFLIEQGIDAARLSARGYGETHPIADNAGAKGRAANRRVEFHIIRRVDPTRGLK